MAGFSESVRRSLNVSYRLDDDAIDALEAAYPIWAATVQGAPNVADLTPDDVHALRAHAGIRLDGDEPETWLQFKGRIDRDQQSDANRQNPFMPNWVSKTDDRPRMWVTDTLNDDTGNMTLPTRLVENLDKVFREAAAFSLDRLRLPLVQGPTVEWDAMLDVMTAMQTNLPAFFHACGQGEDPTWKWGPAVASLAGFGYQAFKHLGLGLMHEEHWDYYMSLQPEDWIREVCKCRDLSGYPVALFRADAIALYRAVHLDLPVPPRWMRAAFALHFCKYVRYAPDATEPSLMVAYNGRHALLRVHPENLDQPLGSSANLNTVGKQICTTLGIPYAPPSASTRTLYHDCTQAVLNMFHPRHFSPQRKPSTKPTYIVPNGVQAITAPLMHRTHDWINTGIAIKNVAVIDAATGNIDVNHLITGPDTIGYQWPRTSLATNDLVNWRSTLPANVPSEPPSYFIQAFIRNINYLGGNERAWASLTDATFILDLLRQDLAGSEIGNVISKEFPLLAVYPTGSTLDDTTNQGKTNLCRMFAGIMAPGIGVTMMNRNTSAPMLRSLAMPIRRHGTILIDEFVLPTSADHFLNKEQLQGLCTGGIGTPGLAGENDPGIALAHPIVFCSKVSAIPPDMRNRQLPTFMDVLTEGTRCTDEELNLIMTARLPLLARLAALRWIHDKGLAEKIRNLPLRGDKAFRFDAHFTVALMLIEERGGTREELLAYLKAAEAQCDSQLADAGDSGLTEELGVTPGFSIRFFLDAAQELTMEFMAMRSSQEKGIALSDALRMIVEDSNRRSFEAAMRESRTREQLAVRRLSKELSAGPIRKGHFVLRLHSDDSFKDDRGRVRKYITVERVAQPSADKTKA